MSKDAQTYRSRDHGPGAETTAAYARELLKLEAKHGGVSTRRLVDEARDPESVFHDAFEWDDTKAAEAYRHTQARHLIQEIKVSIRHVGGGTKAVDVELVRAFHSVEDDEGNQFYVSLDTVRGNPRYHDHVIGEVTAGMNHYAAKLETLKGMKPLASETRALAKRIGQVGNGKKKAKVGTRKRKVG